MGIHCNDLLFLFHIIWARRKNICIRSLRPATETQLKTDILHAKVKLFCGCAVCWSAPLLFRCNKNGVSRDYIKIRKSTKIRNRYNQAPHLAQDTNGKVTTSQLDIANESEEVSPFPAGDHK